MNYLLFSLPLVQRLKNIEVLLKKNKDEINLIIQNFILLLRDKLLYEANCHDLLVNTFIDYSKYNCKNISKIEKALNFLLKSFELQVFNVNSKLILENFLLKV